MDFENSAKRFLEYKGTTKRTNSSAYIIELDIDLEGKICTPLELNECGFWKNAVEWIYKDLISIQVVKFDYFFEIIFRDFEGDEVLNQALLILELPKDVDVDLMKFEFEVVFVPFSKGLRIIQK